MRASVAYFLLACVGLAISNEEGDEEIHFTNSWAVHIDNEDLEAANVIAKKHGFVNQGQIGSLPGYYHFVKNTVGERSRRSLDDHSQTLLKEPKVKWVEQQRILERSKRDVIPGEDELVRRSVASLRQDTAVTIRDPFFTDQWYLQNIGQSSGPRGIDINVLPVWARGLSGKGIVVSVLDDGVDHTHPDLKHNYDPDASFDFNDFDSDPKPHDEHIENCHGTKCAGEVAAQANNGICGVGVSFNASIGGIRMLDGKATDTIEGSSLSYRSAYIDIYSCCWGPKDDGKRFGKPGYLASKALQIGAERGRGGLGNVYVWATGNGGLTDDDCNCDGYTTSIYTISIGAISDHGLSTYYTETCASTLAVTFSGGSHRESIENKIVTTDLHHKCTGVFKGTSSAAPLAAGMMALVLESNPRLSWRDVQHIIVETSQVTSPLDEGWKTNGAGKRFNHKFGFGRLDASRLVEKALKWKNVDKQKTCPGAIHNTTRFIPASGSLILSANTSACASTASEIRQLEHVQLRVSLQHRHRGDLSVSVISPSGTRSELLTTRRNDHSARGLKDWIFMTVHFWGEDPRGLWTVIVTDNNNNNHKHYVQKVKQGDAEDVTRIFMDDTGKRFPEQSGDTYRAQKPPSDGPAKDHVMKTMEDTAGKLFKGNGFAKFVQTIKMHHGKPKNSNAIKVQVTVSAKHSNSVMKDRKRAPLHKKSTATFSPKKSSKRLANKGTRKHMDIVQGRHNRKAVKKQVKFKKKSPRKTANSKLNKRRDFRKKKTRAKLKLHRLQKSIKNPSNVKLNQTLKTSLNRSTSTVVRNSSSSSNPTVLGLITKLLSEIQKNPLVTKIAMEAIKDPAVGRLFGLSEKPVNIVALNSTDGQKSDLHDKLERNSSLPNTSIPAQKQNETNTIKGNTDSASQTESTTQERDSKLDSSDNGGKMYVNTTHTFSENYVDVLINKTLAVSGSGSGSGSEGSGSGYWNTGSGRGQTREEGSAENADRESMKNPREMGCKKEMGQCNQPQLVGGISIVIQSNSSNESSKEIEEGEDSFFEVTDQDDRDSVYAEGNGDEVFENVKKVVESDDGPIEFLPAFDRSGINSQNDDSISPCDYSTQPRNISSSFGKHCPENETLPWNANENPYENEQLANYLARSKLRGSPNGSSQSNEMENHDSKDEIEPYYIDKSDETDDAQDEMVAKYSNKDLEVLQEALEEQLSRLSKDPASQKSNAEILARVRDDINHGDIEDLELLEAQMTGGKSPIRRVGRSTAPEDEYFDDLDDNFIEVPETFEHVSQEDDELERRRVGHRTENYKSSQTYYVDPDKYGRDNSGILESWTLILYGTK